MFKARKTHKAYIGFGIFSLCFIVLICKNFRFASNKLMHTNADLKICQYICLLLKIISRRLHIKTPFTFLDMCTWDMQNVCLQTFRNNRICQKLAYFFRNLQTSLANNLRILWNKNAKLAGCCFCMNTNIVNYFYLYITGNEFQGPWHFSILPSKI